MSSPPTTLGQYQIIREIARSNDIVYEAYDPLMNRRVAVKELSMPGGLTPQQQTERISRFKREAQAAGTLNHPSIMTVYSFSEDAGRHFMAMEYLDGCTLRNEIDTKGYLTQERAVEIATAVLDGLGHAHSKGVIHRDIKPENIQLLSNGGIKITDFGIARLTFQPNLTVDGQVFGTPSYMSPEQVVGKEIDQRSDLFSVGVVLYEMLSGQKPFTGDSVVTISYAIMNKEPQQPSQLSYEVWSVVRKAIEKVPQMRYQNAEEFISALKDAQKLQSAPMPDPVASPYNYGQTIQSINAPPPIAYQHNPYAVGQPSPYVPQQQGFPQPQTQMQPQFAPAGFPQPGMQPQNPLYTQAPIYYPPPPRRPLFKPERVAVLKNTVLWVVLIGTLFLIIGVSIQQVSIALERVSEDAGRDRIEQQLTASNSKMSAEDRVKQFEQMAAKYKTEADKAHYRKVLAGLHEQAGREMMSSSDANKQGVIENHFNSVVELDSANPAGYADKAAAYERRASDQNVNPPYDGSLRADAYANAAKNWIEAAKRALDPDRAAYAAAAARTSIQFAEDVLQFAPSRKDEASQLLSAAKALVQDGSSDAAKLRQEIARLG